MKTSLIQRKSNKASVWNIEGRELFKSREESVIKNIEAGIHDIYLEKKEYLTSIESLVCPESIPSSPENDHLPKDKEFKEQLN